MTSQTAPKRRLLPTNQKTPASSSPTTPSTETETAPDGEPPASRRRSDFIRFLGYVAPYKYMVLLASIGGMVKFGVPLLIPQITQHLIDHVFLSTTLTKTQKLNELYKLIGGTMVLYVFFWSPWVYARHYFAGKAGHKSVFDLRVDLYYRILRMSASFFDRNQSGAIVSRLISDIELAQNLVGSALTNVWMDLVSLVLILFFLLRIDVGVTLVTLVTFPVYLILFRQLKDRIQATSRQVQQEISEISGNLQEKIAGNRIVHAFTQEARENRYFQSESDHLLDTTLHRVYLQSINMMLTGVIVQLAPLIVMLYGGYRVVEGSLTVGQLVAVSLYLSPLYTPLQRFSELNVVFSNSMAALARVFEIMDQKPEIRDRPNAIKVERVEGRVEFDDVCFAYHNEDEPERSTVLEHITLTVEPGQKVAFVGPSGAGKSTIVGLIPRFYDVDWGSVRIDGIDVRDYTVKSLRKQVGMVLQTPILFSGTIRENIRYGRPKASMEEIVEAAKAANAYEFVNAMPRGFDSQVGEMGNFLSGGQKQRITIARAFLKDPRILILDEATSALDTESERLIQAALERLMEGRTTFIIAHRLSTIENADRIIVMEQGQIVESGTHADLLARDGVYHQLYTPQALA
ncbi:MAG: ABC transporter ATP-binding protein [Anaerolineae bacterium]|nr:ABC transporter ATP-binding protein [Anaerolineae bacterium]